MWSSDYPHSETTFPRSHEVIKRDFAGIPEEDIRDIICNNARRSPLISGVLLSTSMPSLAGIAQEDTCRPPTLTMHSLYEP